MKTARALDLFCCAGGASKGLVQAGFEVVGVDIAPQKRYRYRFLQEDAIAALHAMAGCPFAGTLQTMLPANGVQRTLFGHRIEDFDLIWASPPCQFATEMNNDKSKHVDLIAPVRALFEQYLQPHQLWVIENVEGARPHMRSPVLLCGSMFGLGGAARDAGGKKRWFQLQRHRLFEANFPICTPACNHTTPTIGVYGGHVRCRSGDNWRVGGADFPGQDKKALARAAMGIDWMTLGEMSEAIPPAYSQHIGNQARAFLAGNVHDRS